MNKDWLLSDDVFEFLTEKGEHETILLLFWDNGITSPLDSFNHIESHRFEYTDPDCPRCGCINSHYKLSTGQWKCKKCGHKFSIVSGTGLDNTKLEYYKWWRFCWLVGDMKIINSCTIAIDLGVTQTTAWGMLETLRRIRIKKTGKSYCNSVEPLVFNNRYEVLEMLLSKTDNC